MRSESNTALCKVSTANDSYIVRCTSFYFVDVMKDLNFWFVCLFVYVLLFFFVGVALKVRSWR